MRGERKVQSEKVERVEQCKQVYNTKPPFRVSKHWSWNYSSGFAHVSQHSDFCSSSLWEEHSEEGSPSSPRECFSGCLIVPAPCGLDQAGLQGRAFHSLDSFVVQLVTHSEYRGARRLCFACHRCPCTQRRYFAF